MTNDAKTSKTSKKSKQVAVVTDSRLSDEGLKEIVLQLGNREIVVSEEDYFSEHKRGRAVQDILSDPLEDEFLQAMTTALLPSLVACSYGDLPDHHQFGKMAKDSIKLWIEKARELNPGVSWFDFLDQIEKATEDSEKELAKEVEKKDKA